VLGTGDELVAPVHARTGEIVYSNGFAIRALVRSEGAETIDLGVAPTGLRPSLKLPPRRAAALTCW